MKNIGASPFLSALVRPPFHGVIWAAWLSIAAVCLLAGGGPFDGLLTGFDDRVRMTQALNWVNGADWYDRTIMRVNPPDGFRTIWSRLVDIPIAAIIFLLQGWLGQTRAALAASTILPLAQTLALFYAAAWFSRPLVGRRHAALVTLFVIFTSCINTKFFSPAGFQPGSASHHPWYLIFWLLLGGGAARLALFQANRKTVLIAALSIGGLLAIGIESLPMMAGLLMCASVAAWLRAAPASAAAMARTALYGAGFGLALLPAHQPPELLFTPSFAEPSILGPVMMCAASFALAIQSWAMRKYPACAWRALAIACLAAALLAAGLVLLFPGILQGPAAALTPEERVLAAAEHTEAKWLFEVRRSFMDYVHLIAPSVIALGMAAYSVAQTRNRRRRALYAFYGLAALWSFGWATRIARLFHYANLSACPWLLHLCLAEGRRRKGERFRLVHPLLVYMALGPLTMLTLPVVANHLPFVRNVLLFPAAWQLTADRCNVKTISGFLDTRYGQDTLALVPMYESDKFLFHTRLRLMFLANYPSQNKFIDAKAFYETRDEEKAKDIARRHGVGLVALCRSWWHLSPETTLYNRLMKGRMNMGQKLVTGNVPSWLRPVDPGVVTPWLLFEVMRGKLNAPPANGRNTGSNPESAGGDRKADSPGTRSDSK